MTMPVPTISAADLKKQLDEGAKLRLVDVREPAEWTSELGHIAGAELIPLGTVPANLAKLQGEEREIIAICKSGMRSQQAADFLAKNGLKVKNLQGGMMAWKGAGLPTTRDP
jgi:hydroxyacylglutathione hydrolase